MNLCEKALGVRRCVGSGRLIRIGQHDTLKTAKSVRPYRRLQTILVRGASVASARSEKGLHSLSEGDAIHELSN